tara:strand:+ start:289 stop:723 length:435 start_codon:yes stop_codon:yes gene_type:complete
MRKLSTNKLLEYCIKHNKSLTPTRALIVNILSCHSKPRSAYDLQEEINKKNKDNINISTIYRVLDFWMKLGLVHKISSINKFLLCLTPHERHIHMLNFCTSCEKVIETCSDKMGLNFSKSMSDLDLSLNKKHSIEIPVLCTSCN